MSQEGEEFARNNRAVGAVVGAIIADAAAAPLHWIYDLTKVRDLVSGREAPEFLETSHCPFYTIPSGRNTCYGEQVLILLKSLVDCEGFNKEDYKKKLYAHFGPESDYEVKLSHAGPPVKADMPIAGPWRNGSIREFLKNYEDGNDKTGKEKDAQADAFSKMAPLAALYAGNPLLPDVAEQVIRVTQEDELAVKLGVAAAHILEQIILNGHEGDLLKKVEPKFDEETRERLQSLRDTQEQDHPAATKSFGTSCALPGSFLASLHCVLQSDGDFVTTVRTTLTASGDNASRCCLVGGAMGARVGRDQLPLDWISKTSCGSEVLQLAEALVAIKTA